MAAARFPLNLYLLRAGGSPSDRQRDVPDFPLSARILIDQKDGLFGELRYGPTEGTPEWLRTLSQYAESPLDELRTGTVSGVLVAEVNDKRLLATFGHAWQKVKSSDVVPNFGIRCVLNLAKEDSLRAIRRDRVAEESIQAIEQIPDHDDIYRFGIDVEKDLLRGVKAKLSEDDDFGVWVAGGDSFKGSIDLNRESIASYLMRCLAVFGKADYKSSFPWVDNIAPLRDADLQLELLEDLVGRIKAKDAGLTLSAPDLLRWDDHDFFSFERKKRNQRPCANHLDLGQWVEYFRKEKGEIDIAALMDSRIYAYRDDGTSSQSWPVIDCVHGLLGRNGKCYLIHGGQWFEISSRFVDQVNLRVRSIPAATISLPNTTVSEKEGDYSSRVSDASSGFLLLMDKKLIGHGGGKSKIEVCDLLSEDGHLICVKPWGGSSGSLSHLFLQAKNSIQLMNNDEEYREKVLAAIRKINANFEVVWQYLCEEPKGAEVVLAILRGCDKESLPFFSKLSLSDCVSELRKMRIKASYLYIPSS